MNKIIGFFVFIGLISAVFVFAKPTVAVAKAENEVFEIIPGMYDLYTDSDHLTVTTEKTIRDYINELYGSTSSIAYDSVTEQCSLSVTGDDPIVQIVPKELFCQLGNHLYIGKEYGFFVKTVEEVFQWEEEGVWCQSVTANRKATVFVFDITTIENFLLNASRIEITVEPILQYEFAYIKVSGTFFSIYDIMRRPSIQVGYSIDQDRVVPVGVFHDSGVAFSPSEKYYLKDLAFGLQLLNEQKKNDFQQGYDAGSDNGAFLVGYDYSYSGIAFQNNLGQTLVYLLNDFSYILGAAGTITSSALLGMLSFATGLPGFILNTRDLVNCNNAVSMQDSSFSDMTLYASKATQIANYGNLIKRAGLVLHPSSGKKLWYKTGSTATMSFIVSDSTPNGQSLWQTRIMREIGLQVVDEYGNVQQTASSQYEYKVGDPEVGILELEDSQEVSLLPNGEKQFSFMPTYTSHYTFSISDSAPVSLSVDEAIVNGTNNTFQIKLNAGTTYVVKIISESACVSGSVSVEPYSSFSNIQLSPNSTYLVKQLFSGNVYKNLVLSDSNLRFYGVYILSGGLLSLYENFGQSWYEKDHINVMLTPGIKYFLIKNPTASAKTGNISVQEVPVINSGSNSTVIENNLRCYKFIAPTSGNYVLNWDFPNVTVSVVVRNVNFQQISQSSAGGTCQIENLAQNESVLICCKNADGTDASGHLLINKAETAYKWKVDGTIINGSSVSLEIGSTYAIRFCINGVEQFPNLRIDRGANNAAINSSGNLVLLHDAEVGSEKVVLEQYANANHSTVFSLKLRITTLEETKLVITGQVSNQTQLGFSWQTNVTGITKFEYRIVCGSNVQYKSVNVNGTLTSGTVNILSFVSPSTMSAVDIVVYRITLNGVQVNYYSSLGRKSGISTRFASGTGSASNPYIISCIRHFNNIGITSNVSNPNRDNLHYKQTANLDYNETATPRGVDFYGTYNGMLNSILGVKISSDTHSVIGGLFATNYGTISGLLFLGITINFDDDNVISAKVGGVVGINESGASLSGPATLGGSIELSNNIQGFVGGVAGVNSGTLTVGLATFELLKSKGTIGGFVGKNTGSISNGKLRNTTIQMGYSNSSSNDNHAAGGIVGINEGGSIKKCSVYSSCGIYWVGSKDVKNNNLRPMMGILVGHMISGTLGTGAQGTVYKGELTDSQAVYVRNANIGKVGA